MTQRDDIIDLMNQLSQAQARITELEGRLGEDCVVVRRDQLEPVIEAYLVGQEDTDCTCWISRAAREIRETLKKRP
jgi:hypothetical protein